VTWALVAACGNQVTTTTSTEERPEFPSAMLGGTGSVISSDAQAFSLPLRTLDEGLRPGFVSGDALFRREWSSELGLGPTYIAVGCSQCHVRDGRGAPLDIGEGSIVKVSGAEAAYGAQVQVLAVPGVPAEARVSVEWVEEPGSFEDGETYTLRRPVLTVTDPVFGTMQEVDMSLRVAPPVLGSGLLEAVPESEIAQWEDAEDANGDDISGRVNRLGVDGATVAGRFGWKASQSSVLSQSTLALWEDIGVTSSMLPTENCPEAQTACAATPSPGPLSDEELRRLELYVRGLGVPAMRDHEDPEVQAGFEVFVDLGCEQCHRPTMRTGDHELEALADETIHAFTDLLVHDMGERLADGLAEGDASGSEWRTAPLWGIGLTETVTGATYFLHDGRARNLTEAIVWHGGEADDAMQRFRGLSADDRSRLLTFLASL
jgi:CxxC motif-containing protein (DUF1111 family)